jgi:hypothetical protein
MTAEETIAVLEAQLKQALEQLTEVTEQLRVAQARIEELEKLKTPPPAFVKARKKKAPEEQKKARKKREARHNRARRRSTPTHIVEHRLLNCSARQLRLGGLSLARTREIIDVPPPPPVEVTEHRIYKGWCAGCQKWYEAPVDLHEQVVGKGRIGERLSSLIATLRTVMICSCYIISIRCLYSLVASPTITRIFCHIRTCKLCDMLVLFRRIAEGGDVPIGTMQQLYTKDEEKAL